MYLVLRVSFIYIDLPMKKILIAEDDFFIRDIYSKMFVFGGFDVQVAVNGEDAIVKAKERAYDMILLDIMMPRISGIDVLRHIRTSDIVNKSTPIFIITNLAEQDKIEEAFKLGMDGYIIKSQVTPQQIVDEINAFLESKAGLPPVEEKQA